MKKILLISFIIISILLGIGVYYINNALFSPNFYIKEDEKVFYIRSGSTFDDVLQNLSPYLNNKNAFIQVAHQKKYSTNIRSGRFLLKNKMNNLELISTLQTGNKPFSITFNNQDRLENLSQRIAQQLQPDSLELINSFTDPKFLEENSLNRENILQIFIPNTYEFYWNISAEQFRNRMLKEYHRFWNENRRKKAENLGLTPLQVGVLASIVQKETIKNDEKPRVAGVYLNRLAIGMPLQADPTVVFSIKEKYQKYDTIIRRVLYKDLEIDSPYNTYKHKGLPPAAICMPDISSIEAVLNPESHNYLYFVADTQKAGYHKFAKTLQQHNQNKRLYVEWLQKQNITR